MSIGLFGQCAMKKEDRGGMTVISLFLALLITYNGESGINIDTTFNAPVIAIQSK